MISKRSPVNPRLRADTSTEVTKPPAWLEVGISRAGEILTRNVRTWEQRQSLPERKRTALLGFLLALLLAGLSVWFTLAVGKLPCLPSH